MGEEERYDSNLIIEPYLQDQLVVVCGPGHELAGTSLITSEILARQKFVLREKGSSTRDMVDKIVQQAGIPLSEVWELPSTESIKQVLMSNWGLSILSFTSVRGELQAGYLVTVPLKEQLPFHRSINLAFHRSKIFTPALTALYHFLGSKKEAIIEDFSSVTIQQAINCQNSEVRIQDSECIIQAIF